MTSPDAYPQPAEDRIAAGRVTHGVGDSEDLPGNISHLVSPVVGQLRRAQRDGTVPDLDWIIDRLSLVLDMARVEAETSPRPVTAHVHEEWGVERSLPNWNGGEPFIEWGGWRGHDGYRVDYTPENIWSLAGGRPVHRRVRTTYRDHMTDPVLVERSADPSSSHNEETPR